MIEESIFRKKIKRQRRRSSRQRLAYYVNSFGTDHIIWRSLCALYTQLRIEKDQKRYLSLTDMIWLLAMKQFCVESGQDKFHMREVRRYMNFHFKTNRSAETSATISKRLIKSGYITLDGLPSTRTKYILTMKARAFYQDLYELFSI